MHNLSSISKGSHQYHIRSHETAVSIRQATIVDANTITDMGNRLIPAAHDGALPTTDMNLYLQQSFNLVQVENELHQPAIRFFLAEIKHRVAGMVKINPSLSPLPGLGQRPIELSRLYLNPNWIGKGVGAALMKHALSQADQANHDLCWLLVWTGNQRALAFYKRWNFTIASTMNYPVGQSQLPAHIMIHKIKS